MVIIMNFFYIFIKSIFSIVALFFFTKAMGKKQLSQLNLYDYVIGITIGSVAADISIDLESHFLLWHNCYGCLHHSVNFNITLYS